MTNLTDQVNQVKQTATHDNDDAVQAHQALEHLTHLNTEPGRDALTISGLYRRWQQWWPVAGSEALIYKPDECVAEDQLP